MATRLPSVLLIGTLAGLCGTATVGTEAALLTGLVRDEQGTPVTDAIVAAQPVPAGVDTQPNLPTPAQVIIDQRQREFIPHVLVIRTGTAIAFPNSDNIQHHVYSLSKGNEFEIRLYSGMPLHPVTFKHPGVVVLGCNIHDWMVGYVYVTDAPFFDRTRATGAWSLDLPPGRYRITLWHPDAVVEPAATAADTAPLDLFTDRRLTHVLSLKRSRRDGKPPANLQLEAYPGEP